MFRCRAFEAFFGKRQAISVRISVDRAAATANGVPETGATVLMLGLSLGLGGMTWIIAVAARRGSGRIPVKSNI